MNDTLTVIDANTQIEGKLKGQDARILGRFKGEIELSGKLYTGETSRVEATALVDSAEISGAFDGSIKAKTLVLLEKATVTGQVDTQSLAVREGAHIDGGVNAGSGSKPASAEPVSPLTKPPARPPTGAPGG